MDGGCVFLSFYLWSGMEVMVVFTFFSFVLVGGHGEKETL